MWFDAVRQRVPLLGWLATGAVLWLVLITFVHSRLNAEHDSRPVVKMGYMPVVTNLSAPILDHVSQHYPSDIRWLALKFSSFAEMAEALRNGHIEIAFIIAPLAVVLHQQGERVHVVYIGNRHESTLVARTGLTKGRLNELAGKTVAVPMRYSGHNLSLRETLQTYGLAHQVNIVEMNPPDMPAALVSGGLDAYFVGEPFAAATLYRGQSELIHYVETVWPGFICNLALVNQQMLTTYPERVQAFVQGAARAGFWAKENIGAAAQLVASYWNQDPALVEYALTHPANRIVFDQFTPRREELQEIADLMQRHGLTSTNEIDGLVLAQFASNANVDRITGLASILAPAHASVGAVGNEKENREPWPGQLSTAMWPP